MFVGKSSLKLNEIQPTVLSAKKNVALFRFDPLCFSERVNERASSREEKEEALFASIAQPKLHSTPLSQKQCSCLARARRGERQVERLNGYVGRPSFPVLLHLRQPVSLYADHEDCSVRETGNTPNLAIQSSSVARR